MSGRSSKAPHPASLLAPLGTVVQALRREADLTQVQLAERTGLHPTYISHIERGASNPSWAALSRLSKGLEVPRWVLVKRVDELGRG